MTDTFRVGARTSRLARRQADLVIDGCRAAGADDVAFVGVRTSGDLAPDVPIGRIGGTGVFTRELERALLEREIDAAVHSLKDLATTMPDGLILGAVLPREDPADALVLGGPLRSRHAGAGADTNADDSTDVDTAGAVLGGLPEGAVVGTSSLRRRAFLLRLRPDLEIRPIRGNVPTRLEKLEAGDYDAIVLAAAGLRRLGREEEIDARLPVAEFPPAPGQGAVAVQVRAGDRQAARMVRALDDARTRSVVSAERAFLQRIEGGCQVPAGALGRLDGDTITLTTLVCAPDGRQAVAASAAGLADEAAAIGVGAADRALRDGADAILAPLRASGGEA